MRSILISPPPAKRLRIDPVDEEIPKTDQQQLSIYSWNVNGIEPLLQTTISEYWSAPRDAVRLEGGPAPPIRRFLRRHEWPTMCFLQEVKIRPGDHSKIRAVRRAVSNSGDPDLPDYEAHFCLPSQARYPRALGGKVYGVCTLIRKDYLRDAVEQVREVEWDDEGRILVTETTATGFMPKLAILNVYLVNGTDLPYRDTASGLHRGTRHDRKLEVHKLLQRECRALQEQGFQIIIAGDINVARSALDGHPNLRTHPHQHVLNRADFENRFMDGNKTALQKNGPAHDDTKPLDMLDTFRALHPTERGYSYFTRSTAFGDSCDRVDMILVSRPLIAYCETAGMHQTLAERATSDHVPIFAKFAFDQPSSTS